MKKILLIDNYDSFTYNLVQLFYEVSGQEIDVKKNDQVSLSEIAAYDYLVISPGPGIPDEAGITKEAIKTYASSKPILGVCLGLQAIGEVFGAELKNLPQVYHGIQTKVKLVEGRPSVLFEGMEPEFEVGRYHSWAIDSETLTPVLEVTSTSPDGEIMSIQHTAYPVYGVQYHPESILTPQGDQIITNFLSQSR